MHLGIDLGTTRTVVACCDRGNYPVISFTDAAGDPFEWYPSIAAAKQGELRFGFDALAVATDPSWTLLRSFKRLLAGPTSRGLKVEIGDTRLLLADLLAGFLSSLRDALLSRSNIPRSGLQDDVHAVIATPANAHGTQRFMTLDAFRRADFKVAALLNEPSAAGFEYAHRYRSTLTKNREHIVVYDLGGGTFDASLVRMSGKHHDVVTTAGINRLGGDDFDAVLVNLALERAGLRASDLSHRAQAELAEQARVAKEALNPSSRRMGIDLRSCLGEKAPVADVTIATTDYYDACTPLIERSIEAMTPVMGRLDGEESSGVMADIAGIYVVGGGSCLPAVGRMLRERFGRRVHRSPYPFAATAIGLAVAADETAGFKLEDRFSRNFGVFREALGGSEISFDPIFTRDVLVPDRSEQPLTTRRVYHARHNVGHFRLVECTYFDETGTPRGDITPLGELLFPFDRSLRQDSDLGRVPIRRSVEDGPLIEERYSVDAHGIVQVTICDMETGYEQAYRLG